MSVSNEWGQTMKDKEGKILQYDNYKVLRVICLFSQSLNNKTYIPNSPSGVRWGATVKRHHRNRTGGKRFCHLKNKTGLRVCIIYAQGCRASKDSKKGIFALSLSNPINTSVSFKIKPKKKTIVEPS